MKEVVLGSQVFRTIKQAEDYVRNLIHQTGPISSVKQLNIETYQRLLEVLQSHPDATSKLSNISDIAIRQDPLNKKALALFVVKDQEEDDISWRVCIKPRSSDYYLLQAMRQIIVDQILDFKTNSDVTRCEICNTPTNNKVHVDHIIPFSDLVKDFIKDWEPLPPSRFKDNSKGYDVEFLDEDEGFEIAWKIYHKAYATLRITCPSCNLRRKRSSPQSV